MRPPLVSNCFSSSRSALAGTNFPATSFRSFIFDAAAAATGPCAIKLPSKRSGRSLAALLQMHHSSMIMKPHIDLQQSHPRLTLPCPCTKPVVTEKAVVTQKPVATPPVKRFGSTPASTVLPGTCLNKRITKLQAGLASRSQSAVHRPSPEHPLDKKRIARPGGA